MSWRTRADPHHTHTYAPSHHKNVRRHGAILGLAEVFLALAQLPTYLPGPLVDAVVDVVPRVEKARLYRGRGGEMVRAAACRLIEAVARAGVPLPVKTQVGVFGVTLYT